MDAALRSTPEKQGDAAQSANVNPRQRAILSGLGGQSAESVAVPVQHATRQGPSSIYSGLKWPAMMGAILPVEHLHNLRLNMLNLIGGSHYSGLGGFEIIMAKISQYLQDQADDAMSPALVWHACDIDPVRQKVLAELPSEFRPMHIFKDIAERLPQTMRSKIEKSLPKPDSLYEAKAATFQRIKDSLRKFYLTQPEQTMSAPCVLHGADCPLWQCFCRPSCFEARHQQLSLNVSGPICADMSRFGKQAFDGGQSMLPLTIWLCERAQRQEDIVIVENTADWPPG